MVHSMTAFARAERAGPQGTLSWEMRSVNHRYLEPHLRLPESFRDLEGAVREALRQYHAATVESSPVVEH